MRGLLVALMITMATMVGTASAEQQYGTMEEAKAMSLKAAAYVREQGRDAATKAFMSPGAPWHDRDLYVFVLNGKGVNLAHGISPALVGKDLSELQDVTGKYMVKEFLEVKTEGSVEYFWENPKTKEIETKSSYIVRVDYDTLVGDGAYKR